MITTGFSSSVTKTEIVDVATGVTCSDLADFPVKLHGAVGANLHGTPVVCGGYFSYSNLGYSDKCYSFTNGVWGEEFASMKDKRVYAAAIVYNKKLHVFGGDNEPSRLRTSETINADGEVSEGPVLPTAVWKHAMTTLNDTVSILSGGWTTANSYSAQTWYYNHETKVFTSGPNLLEGRRDHGSATNVDKVTNAKTLIVTGGLGNGYNALDSTELLVNGQWQTGTPYFLI